MIFLIEKSSKLNFRFSIVFFFVWKNRVVPKISETTTKFQGPCHIALKSQLKALKTLKDKDSIRH